MRVWRTNPFEHVELTRGAGCRVWDDRGRSYLDMMAGCWCSVLGHGHPGLVEAIRAQSTTLIHTGPPFLGEEIRRATAALASILPPALDRAVLLNTGSEAVELALKMARAATGRNAVVVVGRSYFGATTYALSLSEAGRGADWLPAVGQVVRTPAPECRQCPAGVAWPCEGFPCLDGLRAPLAEQSEAVAAVVFEPVLANAGIVVPPIGYATELRGLAAQLGALFVSEEVTTGMGRTGRWLGVDHDEVVPDILVLGKALGGGLPVAAVVTTTDVEARCNGVLTHVQSHQNDPFSGRIAATVISIMQAEGLVGRVAGLGDYLLDGLRQVQARQPAVAEVRGRGLMVGVELNSTDVTVGTNVTRQLLERGFIVNYQPQNAAFRLFPPYVISKQEIDEFLEAFESVLSAVME